MKLGKILFLNEKDIAYISNEWGKINKDLRFDGSYFDEYVDKKISNYVRIAINYNEDTKKQEAIFIEKNFLNEKIDTLLDSEAITYRIAQRLKTDFQDDYLDFYGDLLNGMLETISPKITELLWINAYDYILERVVDKEKLEILKEIDLPIHDVNKASNGKWLEEAKQKCVLKEKNITINKREEKNNESR